MDNFKEEGIMKKISFLIVTAGLLSVVISCAGTNKGSIYQMGSTYYYESIFNGRIEQQQKNINKGIESGELTTKEAKLLQDNLNTIQKKYERLRADGILTEKEQENLDKMLDKNSKMLDDKKNNPVKQLYEADIQKRIDRQQNEIYDGITSGKLSKKEVDIVQDKLNDIRGKYLKMNQDGTLTQEELEKIDKLLNENSKMIFQKETN